MIMGIHVNSKHIIRYSVGAEIVSAKESSRLESQTLLLNQLPETRLCLMMLCIFKHMSCLIEVHLLP